MGVHLKEGRESLTVYYVYYPGRMGNVSLVEVLKITDLNYFLPLKMVWYEQSRPPPNITIPNNNKANLLGSRQFAGL